MKAYFNVVALKLSKLFQSVKFYALLVSLILAVQQYSSGKVDAFEFLLISVGALSVFATGRAIQKIGK